jgi:hypothetical protein
LDLLQIFEKDWSAVPPHPLRSMGDVVAAAARDRNEHDVVDVEVARKSPNLGFDGGEPRFRPVGEVHLVDRHDNTPHAKRGDDLKVTPGLARQSFARAHQQHGEVGGRGAGRHVPCVLLMTGASATMNLRRAVVKNR